MGGQKQEETPSKRKGRQRRREEGKKEKQKRGKIQLKKIGGEIKAGKEKMPKCGR